MLGGTHWVRGQHGVSLIETLVVVCIISIVAAIALMQRGSANSQFQRQNVSRELKIAFERARFDSVKRRAADCVPPALVTVTPSSYTLRTYTMTAPCTAVANDQTTTLPTGVVIARYDGAALTSFDVSFNMRGEAGTSPAPQFYVCNVSCSSPTNTTANIVLVTPTGTVNLLAGGAGLPSFGVPSVDTVPPSTGVNPDAVLP